MRNLRLLKLNIEYMADTLTLKSSAITDKGLSDKRPENEDSFLELSQFGIYAVADGVGGAQGGEVASQMAMEILGEAFANKPEGVDTEDILRTALVSANAAIYQMAQDLPKLWNMATTIVALHLAENVATIAHVGDSRLYRVDATSNLYRETHDHSMVADEVRAGRMTEEQAENHPSRNVINRALGAEPTVNVDLKTILIEPGTTFLLCSDGITKHITDHELRRILTAGSEPGSICAYLKTLCYERGAEDNLTAVVVQVADDVARKIVETIPPSNDEEDTIATAREPIDETSTVEVFSEQREPQTQSHPARVFSNSGTFLSLDESTYDLDHDNSGSNSTGMILAAIGMLILGGMIGIGLYHFLLVTPPAPAQLQPISEMKSDNIAVTSFEKLRRTVDSDPAAYLKEIPPPQDAEDFYLIGRAYLLTDEFSKARTALLDAQKHLVGTDAPNTKILVNDIAAALVIVNDSEIQKRFKGEIENATKTTANSNVSR